MDDVLRGLGIMVSIAGSFFGLFFAFVLAHYIIKKLWPAALGAAGGYYLWFYMDTDLAVIFGVVCFAMQVIWWKHVHKNMAMTYEQLQKPAPKKEVSIPGYFDY